MEFEHATRILNRIESRDPSLDNQSAIAEAILLLAHAWAQSLTGVGMRGELGAPDWSTYELKIWELGESLRHFLKRKRWRGQGELLDAVARVLMSRNFGKGRQTFALLLGECGNKEYGAVLGGVLDDPEVYGHAVKALRTAKIAGYAEPVRRVLSKEQGWIRKAAKRYLKDVEGVSA
jgi:hypothetical protein